MIYEKAIEILEEMKDPTPGFTEISSTQFNEWQALNIAIEAIKEKSIHDKMQTTGNDASNIIAKVIDVKYKNSSDLELILKLNFKGDSENEK